MNTRKTHMSDFDPVECYRQAAARQSRRLLDYVRANQHEYEALDERLAQLWAVIDAAFRHTEDWPTVTQMALLLYDYVTHTGQWELGAILLEMGLQAAARLQDAPASATLLRYLATLWLWGEESWDTAYQYADQALEKAVALGDEKLIGLAFQTRGQVAVQRSEWDQALDDLQQAMIRFQVLGEDKLVGTVWIDRADVYWRQGALDQGIECYQHALQLIEPFNDPYLMGRALHGIGNCHLAGDAFHQAQPFYLQAQDCYLRAGNRRRMILVQMNLGIVYACLAENDLALACLKEAEEAAYQLKDAQTKGQILNNLGQLYRMQGNLDEALICYEASVRHDHMIGNRRGMAVALGNIGIIHRWRSQLDEALKCYQQAAAIFIDIEDIPNLAAIWNNMGYVYYEKQAYRQAFYHHSRARRVFVRVGEQVHHAEALNRLGAVGQAWGKWERAVLFHQHALRLYRSIDSLDGVAVSLADLASALVGQGCTAEAVECFEEAILCFERLGSQSSHADVYWEYALALFQLDRTNESRTAARKALAIFEQLDMPIAAEVKNWLSESGSGSQPA